MSTFNFITNPALCPDFHTKTKTIQNLLETSLTRYSQLSVLLIELLVPPPTFHPHCDEHGESLMHSFMDKLQTHFNAIRGGYHELGQLCGVWERQSTNNGKGNKYSLVLIVNLDWMKSHPNSHKSLKKQIQVHWEHALGLTSKSAYHNESFMLRVPSQDDIVIRQSNTFLIIQKQLNMAYKRIVTHLGLDPIREKKSFLDGGAWFYHANHHGKQ
ncbi:hypothetical protein L1D19_21725 [Vibrio natriegens]|uniref:YagK/YfjJ domain-containing protein n=1 Tax=Vibrio natriegens TaxID=691 RepID=UPI001EFCC086|nr:inovirus-type Gp2 protein [Vibrio natriegens]MCG9702690.1 hypothetical protein [Vibrio natriegens]